MAKAIIELLGHEVVDEDHIIEKLCKQDDSIYHESEVLVKWVDDQEFEYEIDEWLKANGCVAEAKTTSPSDSETNSD